MQYNIWLKKQMLKYLRFLIVSIILNVEITDCALRWLINNDIRTGRQVMINRAAANPYRAINTPVSFSAIYTSALGNTRSAGLGIVGFRTLITNDYAVNNTIQNFTTTAIRITTRVYGDSSLLFISVNYIVTASGANFVEVLYNCFLCATLSTGKDLRVETRTGVTIFIGYSSLYVNVYLSGFTLHNSEGLTNYLAASASIPGGTNIINYQFTTNQNNTVNNLCYTTIVFCQPLTQIQYIDWGKTGTLALNNQSAAPGIPFPTAPPNPDYTDADKMFYGMSAFSLSRATQRLFNLDTTDYNTLNANFLTNYGTYLVQIDFFWIATRFCNTSDAGDTNNKWFDIYSFTCIDSCNNTNSSLYNTTPGDFCNGCHYSCLTCTGSLSNNCATCDYNLSRYLSGTSCPCNTTFIDVGNALCYPCQNFIAGCNTCTSTILCTACLPGFVLHPSGICQCSSGFLVSGICTNITGCTSAVEYSGTTYCVACNSTLHFEPTLTYTCQCMASYYLTTGQLCSPKCGDAVQAPEEACDDGNLNDGDGCSSLCIVENKWMCQGGSPTSPSVCMISDNIDMLVKYVRRVTTANRMQVGIKFSPSYSQLSLINFKQYLTTNVPYTSLNATFANGILLLQFDYNQTIEGQSFNLNLLLDPKMFYNSNLSVQIPASGMNAKLTYDSNNTVNYPLQIVVIILDSLALLVMFISCLSERMIGIQMIQTIQTVLYTQAVMKTTPSSLSPLQMLRYSSGFNELSGIDYTRTYTFAFSLSSVGLEKEFLLSYNLMYILMAAVAVFCILTKLKQYYHQSKMGQFSSQIQENKNEEKLVRWSKVFNFAFERVLFLIVFMSMFLIIFALMLQLTDMTPDYLIMSKQFNLFGAGVATAVLITMICAMILNGCFPGILLFPMLMKQYYPPIYFVYQSAFIFVLAFNYTQEYTLYVLAGMSAVFLIYNMAHRPYPEKFHTFVLIFHQVLIIGVIGVYVFEDLTKPTQHQVLYKILNGAIIAALYVVVGLNSYRLYRYYRYFQKNGWDQYGNEVDYSNYNQDLDALKYNQLKSPTGVKEMPGANERKYGTNAPDKSKHKDADIQMEPIKMAKYSKDSAKRPQVQDESAMNWKYNMLAHEDNPQNQSRLDATSRDVRPDTSRERPLHRSKTNEKNLKPNTSAKEDNQDEEFTVKGRNKMDQSGNEQNDTGNVQDTVFDNPYDENGFAKKTTSGPQDPLQAIKRRLKQDFSSKVKTSTLKQYE